MIERWVVACSLILVRVGTMVAVFPLWGGRSVPRLVKIGLAGALASFWFGSIETLGPTMAAVSGHATTHVLVYGVALGREAILGAMLGYAFGLFLVPARIAGEFIGQEMGLTLGGLTDPSNHQAGTVTGQIFEALATFLFFGLNVHHVLLSVVHGTFLRWPVGAALPAAPVESFVSAMASAHEWGLVLAAPLAVCLFVTSVVLALLARAAPQLNLFTVGFALRLGVGLGGAVLFLPELVAGIAGVFQRLGQFCARVAAG